MNPDMLSIIEDAAREELRRNLRLVAEEGVAPENRSAIPVYLHSRLTSYSCTEPAVVCWVSPCESSQKVGILPKHSHSYVGHTSLMCRKLISKRQQLVQDGQKRAVFRTHCNIG